MQASQSNNASDLQKPDLRPDSTFTMSLPSPFAAPIQAARKYLERQRGDATQTGTREADTAWHPALHPVDRHPGLREESSRERDRRLERSLYEVHSIEAGLSFEDPHGDDAHRAARTSRAYLAESDGSEPLFPYAAPGPSPDPESVRGAIFRLTRESELLREHRLSSRGGSERKKYEAGEDTGTLRPAPAAEKPVATQPGESLQFGDVARRLWATDSALSGLASRTGPGPDAAIEGTEVKTASKAAQLHGTDAIPVASMTEETELRRGERGAIHLQPAVAQSISSQEAALRETKPSETKSMNGSPQRSATSGCDVEDGPALAHDACNLLSALALYSELLGSPGVLEERDRHFAGELKLLASRSQILIDRLLRVAARRQGPDTALRGQLKVSGLADATPEKGSVETVVADHAASVRQVTADILGAADLSSRLPEKVRSFSGTDLDAGPAERSTLELPAVPDQNAATSSAQTNLVDLLMRWGSLLSTLAHGTLEVVFGTHASAPVPAGAEALERILVNLVRNARAATAQGGAVRIGVGVDVSGLSTEKVREDREAAPGRVAAPCEISIRQTMVLTVDDSGCGMTEAQIQWILRDKESAEESIAPDSVPAQQAVSDSDGSWFGNGGDRREAASEAASRRGIATNHRRRQGLGLQIVRELVAASGGTLSIQSRPGRGTRIGIRWPVTIAATTIAPVEEARVHPAGETPEAASAVLHVVPQIAAETPSPTIATGDTRDPAGPDGLSETELRAMMLRLHRAGPPERSPLSRRLGNRPESWREAERGLDGVEAGISGRGYKSTQRGTPAKRDAAPKGAIAC